MPIARHYLSLTAVAVLTCGLSGSPSGEGALAENSLGSANQIVAVYRVDLAGFNLGDFRLTTVFRGSDYEMRGEGRFSILEGLIYDWHGTTASTGKVTDTGPEPTMYALNFRGGDKSQQLRMTFDGGAVTEVATVPRKRPNPHDIPITKEQLEGVLDPMTAAFLYARSENPNGDPKVCDQTIPVFDGEARFRPRAPAEADGETAERCIDRLFGLRRDLPREVHPDFGVSTRQSRHQAHVRDQRDRGLARLAAGYGYVRSLSDCATDSCGLWLGDIDLLPGQPGCPAREHRPGVPALKAKRRLPKGLT